jgi:hypothetical protein
VRMANREIAKPEYSVHGSISVSIGNNGPYSRSRGAVPTHGQGS